MKTIVFSDVHLTNTYKPRKFTLLKTLITTADRVIVNGDFWDGYICSFDEFLHSEWNKLFPIMKEKTIYLYGNHDAKELCDERVNLFSKKQSLQTEFKTLTSTFHIEHGNRIMPPRDEGQFPNSVQAIIAPISHWIHNTAVALVGPLAYSIYQSFNDVGKVWVSDNLTHNEILVTGHTHVQEIDRKKRYINTGFILHGYASWLEITDTDYTLKKARY